jgi:hypothetical protein
MDCHALEVNLSDTFYFELLIPNLINLGNEMCELIEAYHVPVIHRLPVTHKTRSLLHVHNSIVTC